MPAYIRPLLIMAYFNQPDVVVHFKNNEQISKELEQIDSILDYLFNTLHQLRILHCVNIIVLSDHGMQKIHHRFYFDKIIDTQHVLFANGVVGQIYFPNVTNFELQDKIMETMENLKCENHTFYRVYDKQRIPKRYHFSKSNRIGDIILDGQLGTIFYENYGADYNKTYDHGYDFILRPMHTIFYAYGPNIVRNRILKPFQNIELFNLMLALLNIKLSQSPPNNGTNGRLNSVLDNIPINLPQRSKPLKECTISDRIEEINICLLDISLLISGNEEMCYLSDCSSIFQSVLIKRKDSNSAIALIERVISTSLSVSKSESRNGSAEWIPTSLSVKGTNDLKVNLYSDFVKGHFIDLEMITSKYVELFDEIVVISGPIYDFDDEQPELHLQRNFTPSHIFRAIFRCKDSLWLKNELRCEEINSLDVRAFILPNVPNDYNCLEPLSYLSENKARLRDIELLTGFEFLPTTWLPEQGLYDDEFSITLRTKLPENLWIKEKNKMI
ncbi:Ectonucleotide pyrophosphatase/phosphodiesterase C27A7.1 [Dirofilaria immitis]